VEKVHEIKCTVVTCYFCLIIGTDEDFNYDRVEREPALAVRVAPLHILSSVKFFKLGHDHCLSRYQLRAHTNHFVMLI
jgi:hypothetical protein